MMIVVRIAEVSMNSPQTRRSLAPRHESHMLVLVLLGERRMD